MMSALRNAAFAHLLRRTAFACFAAQISRCRVDFAILREFFDASLIEMPCEFCDASFIEMPRESCDDA